MCHTDSKHGLINRNLRNKNTGPGKIKATQEMKGQTWRKEGRTRTGGKNMNMNESGLLTDLP